jgi:hypothetical protein
MIIKLAVALALLLAVVFVTSRCGVKGPPLPPVVPAAELGPDAQISPSPSPSPSLSPYPKSKTKKKRSR